MDSKVMDLENFIKRVISLKNRTITDEIFLLIQHDRDLMQNYLRLVENEGLNQVNRQIGKAVKKAYRLNDDEIREDDPHSTLIRSHQIFK
ncbi:hypothetical protein [uncultured Alistipes sp.]|nr:hypothetical protein [uncultured Alistipes sp.]